MRLIQITDCHLGSQQSETLLGLNTDQSLEDVLQLIQQAESGFDHILCTGDVASDAHVDCYRRFAQIIRNHFNQPVSWLAGNHDSADIMESVQASLDVQNRLIPFGEWLLVLLDSSVPGQVYGQLAASELDFLEFVLKKHPDKSIFISLHHQIVPVGSAWIDQYVVRNADAFFQLVDAYPQVKIISWGHVHQEFQTQRNGVTLLATPSTCVQFKPQCDDFTVDTQMPGYRWFDLNDDGSFATGVARVTNKQYVIDYKSAGY
ncbi:3',5'-cyclic-AMP phosphodiesterase [Cellvibrio sp. NN19]|uniref:3',5'-cyclic-AMP phosphodiesterase n=1 Tax=Cellvibrio chitinivorans TaxID=3102792 RepID=UPI002B407E04|nr:3',5'-cyclic-AMP phosphodiesterase [Cellvibrio sp. NN19]